MASGNGRTGHKSSALLVGILLLIVGVVVLRTAWVCDDAYISFRTVDNLVHGFGLTWNPDERVQAFTNPLWVFLMTLFYAVTGEMFYTVIFVSLLLTLGVGFVLVKKLSISAESAALSLVLLLCSKAFIDYSTSGLENSLSHLLLVIFMVTWFNADKAPRKLVWLSLWASLAMLNRLDTALLYLPVLVLAYLGANRQGRFRQLIIGLLPLLLWEIFAVIYYGFPLPNTYYAKLGAHVPAVNLVGQGLLYFVETLNLDPLTLVVIFAGVIVAWFGRRREGLPFAVGIVLYLLYVVRIGGDFMSGRFFAAPFIVSVALISRFPLPVTGAGLWAPFVIALTLGLISPRPPLLSDSTFGTVGDFSVNSRGIADERGWYYSTTGLLRSSRETKLPAHAGIALGEQLKREKKKVAAERSVGFIGYACGPGTHLIDRFALADPLLARLPANIAGGWRIGHFERQIPDGYLETLESGENRIVDTALSAYYDKLRYIISGPIWRWSRLVEIFRMNLGKYEYLLEAYDKHINHPPSYADVCTTKQRGTRWNDPSNHILTDTGVVIVMDSVVHNRTVELSVDHNDDYRLEFLRGDAIEAGVDIPAQMISEQGLRVDTITVPEPAVDPGYDAVRIRPVAGDRMYSLGHFRFLDDREPSTH